MNATSLSTTTNGGFRRDDDLAALGASERAAWYRSRCEAAGLDPRSRPLGYVSVRGKLRLYVTGAATEGLAALHGLAVEIVATRLDRQAGVYAVRVRARFPCGRSVDDLVAAPVEGLAGGPLCEAMMNAATRARRRVVLSACGLSMPDESEIATIPGARRVDPDGSEFPRNNSGYGRGQYASPADTRAYTAWCDDFLLRANARWADAWSARNGGEPVEGINELLNRWQLDGHLVKWSVNTGRLDPQVLREPAKGRRNAPYIAIVFARDPIALRTEAKAYGTRCVQNATQAFRRRHPDAARTLGLGTEAEDESQEI